MENMLKKVRVLIFLQKIWLLQELGIFYVKILVNCTEQELGTKN